MDYRVCLNCDDYKLYHNINGCNNFKEKTIKKIVKQKVKPAKTWFNYVKSYFTIIEDIEVDVEIEEPVCKINSFENNQDFSRCGLYWNDVKNVDTPITTQPINNVQKVQEKTNTVINSPYKFLSQLDISFILVPLLSSSIYYFDNNINTCILIFQSFLFYKGFKIINNKLHHTDLNMRNEMHKINDASLNVINQMYYINSKMFNIQESNSSIFKKLNVLNLNKVNENERLDIADLPDWSPKEIYVRNDNSINDIADDIEVINN